MKNTHIFTLAILIAISAPMLALGAEGFGGDLNIIESTVSQDNLISPDANLTNGGAALLNQTNGGCQTPRDFGTLFEYVLCLLVNYITPFLFGLAGVVFLVGVVGYVRAGDDTEKRAGGRDLMWFGIVALFVMISVWGFVNILTRSFFGKEASFPSLPKRATSVFEQ